MAVFGERVKLTLSLCLCGLLWQGCSNVQPVQKVPTYIRIDSFHFEKNPLLFNVPTSANITGVTVYYNNNPIGSFDLPATIPVLASGRGTVSFAPGITVDGLNDLTGVYPFYQIDTFGFTAQPGRVISFNPVTSYYTAIKTHLISNFSNIGASNFGLYGGVAMAIDSGAGYIQLNAIGDSSVDSSNRFTIPTGAAYIEFDYKCTMPFSVGMQSNLGNVANINYYLGGLYPSDHWQKFYLDMTDFAGQYKGDTYNFYIRAELESDQASGRVLIDNIYLVTF